MRRAIQLVIWSTNLVNRNSLYFDLNIKNNERKKDRWTAFHLACINGHVRTLEMLAKTSTEFDINLITI